MIYLALETQHRLNSSNNLWIKVLISLELVLLHKPSHKFSHKFKCSLSNNLSNRISQSLSLTSQLCLTIILTSTRHSRTWRSSSRCTCSRWCSSSIWIHSSTTLRWIWEVWIWACQVEWATSMEQACSSSQWACQINTWQECNSHITSNNSSSLWFSSNKIHIRQVSNSSMDK
jgi:hypothetical protein